MGAWQSKIIALDYQKQLGEGSFGNVFRAKITFSDASAKIVAAKRLKASMIPRSFNQFRHEGWMLLQCTHRNVIECFGLVVKAGEPVLLTEYMPNGDLLKFLHALRRFKVPNKLLCDISYQIASGMEYMAAQHLVHRDLAARNVLVGAWDCNPSETPVVKIGDFGLARLAVRDEEGKDDEVTSYSYTPRYGNKFHVMWCAPECALHAEYTSASDVWSFGVVLWEIFTFGQRPYPEIDSCEIRESRLIEMLSSGYRMPPSARLRHARAVYPVMKACWQLDPKRRPTFEKLREAFENRPACIIDYVSAAHPSEFKVKDPYFLGPICTVVLLERVEVMVPEQPTAQGSENLDEAFQRNDKNVFYCLSACKKNGSYVLLYSVVGDRECNGNQQQCPFYTQELT